MDKIGHPSLWATPAYRRLFAAEVLGRTGTGLTTVALALLAYDLAGGEAGWVLGVALALKMVAYVVVAPLAGALAVQRARQALLVSLDGCRVALLICMLLVSEVWQVYLLVFLLNACAAGFTPSFQATVVDVLPDEARYTQALANSRLALDLESLLSPLLATFILSLLSFKALFVVVAVAFLGSALLLASVRLPSPRPDEGPTGRWERLGLGLRIYLLTPRLRGLFALALSAASAGAMVIVNTVVYVRDHLELAPKDTTLAFAAFGVGSMAVALMMPRIFVEGADRKWMLSGGATLAVGLALGALRPDFLGLSMLWLALGAGGALVQAPAGRLLRRSSAPADRATVYSAHFALSHACWLVTYPLAGWLGSHAGPDTTFLTLGLFAGLGTLAAARLWPRHDPLELEHRHEALEHDHAHEHDDPHHAHDHPADPSPGPHRHRHHHPETKHIHAYVIDLHHPHWPKSSN